MANSTVVIEFLLMGFPGSWNLRFSYFMFFFLIYFATLLGNLVIISVTIIDQNLQTPMYFFLRNLSFLDMCYISVTVPNMCINALTDNRAISMAGCATQIYLVIYCAYVELLFLTIMAQDRYVAICHPLHYPVIMSHKFCVQTTLASLLSGLIYSAMHTGNTFRLSFCQSNVVHQFFCDIPSLLRLSCSDTFTNDIVCLVSIMIFDSVCCTFIGLSYTRIFSTIFKYTSREQGKTFSTCIPHIIVVTVFISTAAVVYLKPASSSDTIQDMILSVFYTIVPPFMNPIIYSLRNKQVKQAVKKLLFGYLHSERIKK